MGNGLGKTIFFVLAENFLIAEKARPGGGELLCLVCLWGALYCTYLPSCCALLNENYSGKSSKTLTSVHFLHMVKL